MWFKENKYKTMGMIFIVLVMILGFSLLDDSYDNQTLLTEPVKIGNIENTINATGTLEPRHYVEVGAQVSGQVEKIYIEEGDTVQAGQLLVAIDATVFETRVQNSEAGLEGNRAQLQQLQAELELATLRANRNKNLYDNSAVSADTLFESQANEKILRAKIRAMKAQIKADTASLAGDKATLGYAKIYAPISGTVVSVSVREGQTLNANQNAPLLLKIADLNVLTLRAEVSEADVNRLHKGMKVYFKTFGSGDRRWFSNIRQILPTPSIINDVVLYQALIEINNDDRTLMDAMTTQVYFVRNSAENTLIAPLAAIQSDKNSSTILRKNGNKTETIEVTVGVRNRTHAQLLSGVKEGDVVVIGSQIKGRANNSMLGDKPKGAPNGFR